MAPGRTSPDSADMDQPDRDAAPLVVAIGASAGGVQALQVLFSALPERTGASFVVILHLDPQAHSDLANILATRTRMPVIQVAHTEQLEPDHVYVIAPDRRLQVVDHRISAIEFDKPRGQRAAIDLFFRSVADRIGDGFAVVLTGAGSDGTVGVRAVKESGGIVLVQDPEEAEYPSMPRSAIATGVVDFVLPLKELAERLTELIDQKRRAASILPVADEALIGQILAHLNVRTGHDFSKYKRSTVMRRVARRIHVTRTGELAAYYRFLRANADEAQALLSDLLITVTTFFRDKEVFEALGKDVIPQLFTHDPEEPIRVWVPGCATGEEAYTIGMLLLEEAARHDLRPPIQIFGTDLDARAIALARQGVFPSPIEADVSEERLRRFFTREADHYKVRQELRDLVLFANHSVLKDPPFSHADLISCRNLLIYLDRDLQDQVIATFHYALNPGGYLLLGPSESPDSQAGLFRTVNRTAHIYQTTSKAGQRSLLPPRLSPSTRLPQLQRPDIPSPPPAAVSPRSGATVHQLALEKYAPPSILVDASHRIQHISENAGRYMQPLGGPMTGDVVDMVRPELRAELRTALFRAFEQQQSTLSLPVLVKFNGAAHRVDVQVRPVTVGSGAGTAALILLIEGAVVEPKTGAEEAERGAADDTIRRLNEQLDVSEAQMRSMREEWSASNEELRASNEELQSMNEEYRSTAEELETSREELQSTNEELLTVNGELKNKLELISRAHSDLQNLIAATDSAILFLDPSLRIKRFTEKVTGLFSITAADEGRMITDFQHVLEYRDLPADAGLVLSELAPIRREIRAQNGLWLDIRMRPYRTTDDKIDGVVITFSDVTDRHRLQEALEDCEQRLKQASPEQRPS